MKLYNLGFFLLILLWIILSAIEKALNGLNELTKGLVTIIVYLVKLIVYLIGAIIALASIFLILGLHYASVRLQVDMVVNIKTKKALEPRNVFLFIISAVYHLFYAVAVNQLTYIYLMPLDKKEQYREIAPIVTGALSISPVFFALLIILLYQIVWENKFPLREISVGLIVIFTYFIIYSAFGYLSAEWVMTHQKL
jgi:hypothetical protein